MKIKLTRPDGTVIEAEGTVEECQSFALAMSPASVASPKTLAPMPLPNVPNPPQQQRFPWEPWQVVPYTPMHPSEYPWVNPTLPQTWPNTTGGWDFTPHVWWSSPLGVSTPRGTIGSFTGSVDVPCAGSSFTMC